MQILFNRSTSLTKIVGLDPKYMIPNLLIINMSSALKMKRSQLKKGKKPISLKTLVLVENIFVDTLFAHQGVTLCAKKWHWLHTWNARFAHYLCRLTISEGKAVACRRDLEKRCESHLSHHYEDLNPLVL